MNVITLDTISLVRLPMAYDTALSHARGHLEAEGFTILGELDFRALLRDRTGEDVGPYATLEVWNPELAARAIRADPKVGVFLPAAVAVYADGDSGSYIAALRPSAAIALTGNPILEAIGAEVEARLYRAVENLAVESNGDGRSSGSLRNLCGDL